MSTFDESFDELYERAYRAAYRVLGNRDEADDAAQDALARACVRWRQVSRHVAPGAWVARVAVNIAIDESRRRRRRESMPPDARHPVTYETERLDLVAALRSLSRRQREVVILRYLVDLPEMEVAEELGCSVGAVKQHATRGLARLRSDLTMTDTNEEAANVRVLG